MKKILLFLSLISIKLFSSVIQDSLVKSTSTDSLGDIFCGGDFVPIFDLRKERSEEIWEQFVSAKVELAMKGKRVTVMNTRNKKYEVLFAVGVRKLANVIAKEAENTAMAADFCEEYAKNHNVDRISQDKLFNQTFKFLKKFKK